MSGPLTGIKVLNCGTAGVGPWAATLLGYLGAEVIKIERPGGELTRVAHPRRDGVSSAFLALNINQRRISLDLKNDSEREQFETLAASADVLIENYRPGVAERIGMGYSTLSALNPGLVMASSPGWGHAGPMRDLGAVDPHLQAFSGFAGLNGSEGAEPEMLRYTHIDPNGSVHLASLIMLGLLQRQRSGRGMHLRSSHLAMALFMQMTRVAETLTTGKPVPRLGSACASSAPNQCFVASDGEWFAIAVETQEQWRSFCTAVELPKLAADDRFAANKDRVGNRAELAATLSAWFARKPARWWLSRLEQYCVPSARLLDYDDLRHHQQILENNYLVEVNSTAGPLVLGGLPWNFSRTPGAIHSAAGQDADAEVAFSESKVNWPAPAPAATVVATAQAPLSALTVVDFSQGLAGPTTSLLLAEAGARVISVVPGGGDWASHLAPAGSDGLGAAYKALQRNKQHLQMADPAALRTLLEQADVVITDNSSAEAFEGLAQLLSGALAARTLHLDISNFGARGPLADAPGGELIFQAMTGYLRDLGDWQGPPVRVGADIAAAATGGQAFLGVLAGLFEREQSGNGQHLHCSQLGALMCMKTLRWANHCFPDAWQGGDCNSKTDAPWRGYPTRGGSIWPTLRTVRDDDHLLDIYRDLEMEEAVCADDSFMTHARDTVGLGFLAQQLKPIWDAALARIDTEQALQIFNQRRGIAVAFSELDDLVQHPQVAAINLIGRAGDEQYLRAPWTVDWPLPPLAPLKEQQR